MPWNYDSSKHQETKTKMGGRRWIVFLLLGIAKVFCDPRNYHGQCSVRLNEIFLGHNSEGFLEVGKICPKDKPFHENSALRGFSIIILKAHNNKLVCIYSKRLGAEKLQDPSIPPAVVLENGPVANRNQNEPDKCTYTIKNLVYRCAYTYYTYQLSSGTLNILRADRSLSAAAEAARDRGTQLGRSDTFTVVKPLSAQHAGSSSRQKREETEFELQPNAKLFFVLKTQKLQHITDGFLAVILLQMDSRKARLRLPCKINSILEDGDQSEIQDNMHDIIVLFANSYHGTINNLKPLFQPNIDVMQYVLPSQILPTQDIGFSKCDYTVDNTIPSVFKQSQLTEGNKNLCKVTAKPINRLFQFPYNFQGSRLESSGKKLILNLVSSLTYYKNDQHFFAKSPRALAASLLNIAESSISRFKAQKNENTIFKKKEKRKGFLKVMAAMDETKRELLYKSITSFYAKNEVATIPQIHFEFVRLVKHHQLLQTQQNGPQPSTAEDEDLFTCCLSTFRKLLKLEGYKFGKLALRDSVIFQPNKILWRRKYLNRMRVNRVTKEYNVLYLDETFIDPHSRVNVGLVKKCYKDFSERRSFTYKDHKVSRGGRIIIIACGGKNGFIQQSNLVYKVSAKHTGDDYHSNVNRASFQAWFEKLMDNVEGHEKKYIFVIDNAPYHTTISAPRSNANKAEMVAFLEKESLNSGLVLPENYKSLLYVEIKEIVRKLKQDTPRYTIDDLARSRGHEIVRIPPYNCDLNPIEAVWKDIKTQVKKQNVQQNIDAQVIQAKNALLTYPADYWNRHVSHIEKLEDEYYVGDMAFNTLLNENHDVRAEAENIVDEAECNFECDNTCEDAPNVDSESDDNM